MRAVAMVKFVVTMTIQLPAKRRVMLPHRAITTMFVMRAKRVLALTVMAAATRVVATSFA